MNELYYHSSFPQIRRNLVVSSIYRIVSVSLLIFFASVTARAQTAAPKQAAPRPATRCEVTALDQKEAQQYLLSLPHLPKNARRFNDLEFAHTPQGPVLLDLYLPGRVDEPLPLIVWVQGGGWHTDPGYRKSAPGRVVGRGYALVSISYRDSNNAKFPAQIEDCKAGIRWLRAHAKEYGIHPNRIGVWGSSAGGHLSALLGTSGGVKNLEGSGGNPNVSSRV
jgi:acetyl esterase/lipase